VDESRVSDPYQFHADPDPFHADPDPFHAHPDPDPGFEKLQI